MVTNLPLFYKRLVSNLKKDCNSNQQLFDHIELDQIVEAAMAEQYPIVSAKKWAISNKNKGQTFHGKN